MRALDRLGVGEAVAARGAAATRSAILTWEGRGLAQVPSDLLEGTVAVHRADLQAALAAAAGDVRLGVEVTAVDVRDDGVVAIGADGSEEPGDLLVGADGLGSVVRRAVAHVPVRYAGYTAWRCASSVPVEPGRLTESWAEAVLKMSRRADKAAQLASPLGWRLRNALVRRLPVRAQRRQLEPLVRYEL